ncbi:YobH family protein [Entomohabitans teleogrylli]|uniref:YobH family protein n=1 Tax=Entomohabitans teleogrylli TaxID=1384589 RepID=UPI00073D3521|nr:YobH family protein [Entomohabitans teleogrylli]
MRLIIRLIMIVALIWIGLLLSGYGVLIGSQQNAGGFGLQCKYLTARDVVTTQYLHIDSGIVGTPDCPILRKTSKTIDNG